MIRGSMYRVKAWPSLARPSSNTGRVGLQPQLRQYGPSSMEIKAATLPARLPRNALRELGFRGGHCGHALTEFGVRRIHLAPGRAIPFWAAPRWGIEGPALWACHACAFSIGHHIATCADDPAGMGRCRPSARARSNGPRGGAFAGASSRSSARARSYVLGAAPPRPQFTPLPDTPDAVPTPPRPPAAPALYPHALSPPRSRVCWLRSWL